jgi:hypothetical protein
MGTGGAVGPPGEEDAPWYPPWYVPMCDIKRAAQWLGCDFFTLMERIERGETWWVQRAIVAGNAEQQAEEIARWWNDPGLPTSSA